MCSSDLTSTSMVTAGETGVDVEVHRLRSGLVGEVVRCARRLGVEAHGAADHTAGADRQVDLPDTLCPDLAGDVLRGVDGHLDVDVEEAETEALNSRHSAPITCRGSKRSATGVWPVRHDG